MMNGRQCVTATLGFGKPDRLARALPPEWGNDFHWTGPDPSPDRRASSGTDEWGCVWENIRSSNLGEVKVHPLRSWDLFETMRVPDISEPRRWRVLADDVAKAGGRFVVGGGVSLYERVHFLRGLENTWIDIYDAPDRLGALIDILADMNVAALGKYAEAGVDGLFFCDDWGLQDRLMIRPESWYRIWQPRYARVFGAARSRGIRTFLHSCGHVLDILPGLIDAGLDVIQLDQQENMGLDNLSRYRGRITFFCPVDIQAVMPGGDPARIREYCHRLTDCLATPRGGFIAGYYGDPRAVGHSQEAIEAMCDEFGRISRALYGS